MTDDHDHHGVAATAAPVHGGDGSEDVGRRDARRADPLQLGGQHVEQHLGIRLAVEVAALLAREDVGQLGGIGQVAVVRQTDPVGRVDVEGLGLRGAVATGRRIAHMADADIAAQLEHVVLLEHVAHQA